MPMTDKISVGVPFTGTAYGSAGALRRTGNKIAAFFGGLKDRLLGSKPQAPRVFESAQGGGHLMLQRPGRSGLTRLGIVRQAHQSPRGGVAGANGNGAAQQPTAAQHAAAGPGARHPLAGQRAVGDAAKPEATEAPEPTAAATTPAATPEARLNAVRAKQEDVIYLAQDVENLRTELAKAGDGDPKRTEELTTALNAKLRRLNDTIDRALADARAVGGPLTDEQTQRLQATRSHLQKALVAAQLPGVGKVYDSIENKTILNLGDDYWKDKLVGNLRERHKLLNDPDAFLKGTMASLQKLDDAGLLNSTLVKRLADFQHMRAWANSPLGTHNEDAAESFHAMVGLLAEGDATTIDTLLGGDSRLDGLAKRMKVEMAKGQEGAPSREAIELRHDLSVAKRTLARALTTERRVWYKLGAYGDAKRVFDGSSTGGVKIDARFVQALRTRGGEHAGRDVNLLIANVVLLEKKLAQLENKPDGGQPGSAAELGLDDKDLKAAGLNDREIADVRKTLGRFADQGLRSTADVKATTESLNKIMGGLFGATLAQDTMRGQATAFPEGRAGLLLDYVFQDITGLHHDFGLSASDDAVKDAFKSSMSRFERNAQGFETPAYQSLLVSTEALNRTEADIAGAAQQIHDLDRHKAEAEQTLRAASQRLGVAIDPKDPKGFETAKLLLRALQTDELLRRADGPNEADHLDAGTRRALEDSLNKDLRGLKGLDPGRMRQTWWSRMSPASAVPSRNDLQALRPFKDLAEAVVTIRSVDDQKAVRMREIEELARKADGLMAGRQAVMGDQHRVVQNAVRAAAMHVRAEQGAKVADFDPERFRDEIEATLRGWGIDTDTYAPEVNDVLFNTFGPDELERWIGDAKAGASKEFRAQLEGRPDLAPAARLQDRSRIDEATMRTILQTVSALKPGDKIMVTAGDRVTVNTGKIPVEHTGTVAVRAQLALAGKNAMEIHSADKDIELILKTGKEGKIGGDVSVDLKAAELGVGVSGGGQRLTGAVLRFPQSEEGRKDLRALLHDMMTAKKVTAEQWSSAEAVFTVADRQIKGEVEAEAFTTAGMIGEVAEAAKEAVVGVGGFGTISPGAKAVASAGAERSWIDQDNANLHIREIETVLEASASVGAGLYAQMRTVPDMVQGAVFSATGLQGLATERFGRKEAEGGGEGDPRYNLSGAHAPSPVLEASVGVRTSLKTVMKQVTDGSGLLQPGTSIVKSTPLSGPSTFADMAFLGATGRDGDSLLAALKAAPPEMRDSVGELLASAKRNDMLAVTYTLDEGVRRRVNDMLVEARDLREGVVGGAGMTREERQDKASRLTREAARLVNDEANYRPAKVQRLPSQSSNQVATMFTTKLIKWDKYAQGQVSRVAATVALASEPEPEGVGHR